MAKARATLAAARGRMAGRAVRRGGRNPRLRLALSQFPLLLHSYHHVEMLMEDHPGAVPPRWDLHFDWFAVVTSYVSAAMGYLTGFSSHLANAMRGLAEH